MSFLGGVDLGSPADRTAHALTRDLQSERTTRLTPENYPYANGPDFVLTHGKLWHGRPLPERYQRGAPSHCFENSIKAARAHPNLRYCEGYAIFTFGGAFMHGWCVDEHDEIVELTFPTEPEILNDASRFPREDTLGMTFKPPETWSYYGVAFDTEMATLHELDPGLPMLTRVVSEKRNSSRKAVALGVDPSGFSDFHHWPILSTRFNPNRKDVP